MQIPLRARSARRVGNSGTSVITHALLVALALVALALAAGDSVAADGAPLQARASACLPAGVRTLARSPQASVWDRHGRFYSCWLANRRRTTLGHSDELVTNRSPTLATRVHIDGEYVAFSLQGEYGPGVNAAAVYSLNARTGHTARIVKPGASPETAGSFVSEVGVAKDGSFVYLQEEGSPCPGEHGDLQGQPEDALLAVEGAAVPRMLDCESADDGVGSITKLTVAAQTVTWIHAGTVHTATLR